MSRRPRATHHLPERHHHHQQQQEQEQEQEQEQLQEQERQQRVALASAWVWASPTPPRRQHRTPRLYLRRCARILDLDLDLNRGQV